MESIWKEDVQLPRFPAPDGDLHTDVLVIGGGLAGLLCARFLTDAGIDCILIEQNRLMGGVSGRTTAKLTSQHGLIYGKLLRQQGADNAWRYWQANERALREFRRLAREADCDFKTQNSYIYATGSPLALEEEMHAYEQLGIPARWEDRLPLPFPVTGALRFSDQGQLHPLKLAAHISKGLYIYENTKALTVSGDRVQTPTGTITAKKIIVTTHFPLLNKHGSYFLKLYQQRSYVIALENAENLDGMYLDCRENGLSVRSAGKWLLLGGGGHRTGKPGLTWTLPESAARKYYPQAKIAASWATQDCMSLDSMPYIGRYSRSTPHLYAATGFNKWGMTGSMLSALILTDLIQDIENPYAALFSPSRSMLHKQLLTNGAEAALNLLRPTLPRCPHMGCALHWNRQEHSWDCPCHGSRFDKRGKLLNGPATDDLKKPPRQMQ